MLQEHPLIRKSLLLAAPVLLVVVALGQLTCATLYDQSPWKGGGFGMFATSDSPGNRRLRGYLLTAEAEIPLRLPAQVQQRAVLARTLPIERHLNRLAEELAALTWSAKDFQERYPALLAAADTMTLREPNSTASVPARIPLPADSLRVSAFDPVIARLHEREQGHTHEPPQPEEIIPVEALRLELWKRHFDAETFVLSATRQLVVTTPVAAQ